MIQQQLAINMTELQLKSVESLQVTVKNVGGLVEINVKIKHVLMQIQHILPMHRVINFCKTVSLLEVDVRLKLLHVQVIQELNQLVEH